MTMATNTLIVKYVMAMVTMMVVVVVVMEHQRNAFSCANPQRSMAERLRIV